MNSILISTILTLLAMKIDGKIFLVNTNATEKGMDNASAKDITLNKWTDDEKGGADYSAAPSRSYEEGVDVKLRCPSPIDFQDCQFKSPSGIIHKLGTSGKPYSHDRVKNFHGVSERFLDNI